MPPKRRTTAARSAGTQRQQATLSFHGKNNKVIKSQSPRTSKGSKKDPALVEDLVVDEEQDVKTEIIPDVEDLETVEEPVKAEAETLDPLDGAADTTTEAVLGGRATESDVGATGGKTGSGWVGEEETQARKVTGVQIKKYWRAKELERKAPRVHQQDLSLHEKILREWDMSGQFGPCIGIARLKRWKRANMLGLKPPIEVLAVLLKEMDAGETKSQRAHVDELMSSRFVAEP